MSYYGFDPNDWRAKLPKGVQFYDFGGGVYQVPMHDVEMRSYLTASLVALCQNNLTPPLFKILAFKIPHALRVRKNSDWAPIVDKMVERWNKGVKPSSYGGGMPVEDLFAEPSPSGLPTP